tara:strand:- start:4246 stop:4716 length:471 start_codon:yes stop_codon:yes gene_type:complete
MEFLESTKVFISEFDLSTIISDVLIRLGLILIGFITLIWFLLKITKKNTFLAYKTENGSVLVSKNAISDLIRQICHNNHGLSLIKAKLKKKKKLIDLQIYIRIESGGQLKAIEQSLQTSIRDALEETFGIESIGRINLIASSIKEAKNTPQTLEDS